MKHRLIEMKIVNAANVTCSCNWRVSIADNNQRFSFPRWQQEAKKWFAIPLNKRKQGATSIWGIYRFFFLFSLKLTNSQPKNWGFHHFKCPCWGAPSSFNCPIYGAVSQFPYPGQFFLSVIRLQLQFKLNVSINHWFVGFHQLIVRLVVSSEFWATFDERFSSMVNSSVFNRGSVKNLRIIRKLILLIAEKIFNKYFERS